MFEYKAMINKAIEGLNSILSNTQETSSIKLNADQTELLEWLHNNSRPSYEASTALEISETRAKYEYGKLDRLKESK